MTSEVFHEYLTPGEVLRLISDHPGAHYKVQLDPKFHQRPGKLFAPVMKEVVEQIVGPVHHKARFRVKIETVASSTVIQIGSPN